MATAVLTPAPVRVGRDRQTNVLSERERSKSPAVPKREQYKWNPIQDEQGVYTLIHKSLLNIDHSYQREHIKQGTIAEIRSKFSWMKFGTLGVSQRSDGSYWVFEGQHRKLAADERDDVQLVPCMVFQSTEDPVRQESAAFLGANTVRGAVKANEKFKALLQIGDKDAIAVQQCLDRIGYKLDNGGKRTGRQTLSCAAYLLEIFREDAETASRVLKALATLHSGEFINEKVLGGAFFLERFQIKNKSGESLASAQNFEKLKLLGIDGMMREVNRCSAFFAKGGPKVWAYAIGTEINKGRRKNFVAVPIPEAFVPKTEESVQAA